MTTRSTSLERKKAKADFYRRVYLDQRMLKYDLIVDGVRYRDAKTVVEKEPQWFWRSLEGKGVQMTGVIENHRLGERKEYVWEKR